MRHFRILAIAALLLAWGSPAKGQEDIFAQYTDNIFDDLDTIPKGRRHKTAHLLGVKYSYDFCTVDATPSLSEGYYVSPRNYMVQYTYYHSLWDRFNCFGLQAGVKYGRQGYTSELHGWGESNRMIEFPFNAQLKFDMSFFRLMFNLGTYYGYRLDTDREGGFDQYDIRHDYGILGGGGLALAFGFAELHFEAMYKFSLCGMYHTNKYSDLYWLLAYPRNIMFSGGLFIKLW